MHNTSNKLRKGKVVFRSCNPANLIQIQTITNQATLCTVNLQSIRNKTTEFAEFVTEHNYDITALTETWLKTDDRAILNDAIPDGYKFLHVPREGRNGGGVGLLHKSNLLVKVDSNPSTSFTSFESLHAQVSSGTSSFRLVILYRPGTIDGHGRQVPFTVFLDEFTALLEQYILHPSRLLITGDFNIYRV